MASRPLAAQPAAGVIHGGTLISPDGPSRIENAVIVIRGERIVQVGPADRIAVPPGAEILEAGGKYIIPGLIDGHVHFRDWNGELFLNHGVTSVLDLGNPTDWILAVRGTARAGWFQAPRIFVSGNIINGELPPGESRAAMGGGGPSGRSRGNLTIVRTEEEARSAVRNLHADGVDFIKVYQELPPPLLRATIEEAHRLGLAVIGHTTDAWKAAEAGINGITHLWGIAETLMPPEARERYNRHQIACPYVWLSPPERDALISKLVASRVFVNPLLVNEHAALNLLTGQQEREAYRLFADTRLGYVPQDAALGIETFFAKVRNYADRWGLFPYLEDLPPDDQREFRAGFERARDFVLAFLQAGGKLIAGTDASGASVAPGLGLLQELELWVASGVPPIEALRAATLYPAQMARISGEVGSVEPGKYADLVILDADPLADIRNTRRIWKVFRGGKQVELGYHKDYANPIPYPFQEYSSSYFMRPQVTSVSPASVDVNSPSVQLQIRGSGFQMRSRVYLAGRPLTLRFINSQRLEVVVPAEMLGRTGTLFVIVSNPKPGGGQSEPLGFVVRPPAQGASSATARNP